MPEALHLEPYAGDWVYGGGPRARWCRVRTTGAARVHARRQTRAAWTTSARAPPPRCPAATAKRGVRKSASTLTSTPESP